MKRSIAVVTVAVTLLLAARPATGADPLPGNAPIVRISAGYRWPLAGTPTVVVAFRPPPRPWLPGHRGVDLASRPGAQVHSAAAGTVAFAGIVAGIGVVSVDHHDGLRTTYQPVRASVRQGQVVAAGAVIGVLLAGHPGCPAEVPACLHWGLRRGDVYLDPLAVLGLARVRLWPVSSLGSPAG